MGELFTPLAFDETGSGPLCLQGQRLIADALVQGLLRPGDSLPPERELAAVTRLSRVTVRKGVAEPVASGQWMQKRGSGIFVASRGEKLERALSLLTSFTKDMARRGKKQRRHQARVCSVLAGLSLLAECRQDRVLQTAVARTTIPPSVSDVHPLVAPLTLFTGLYAFIEGLAHRRGCHPDTPPHLRRLTETI